MEVKDWSGNTKSVFVCNGDNSHSEDERATGDYYATDPKAVEALLKVEKFSPYVWESACGGGHIVGVLEKHGYKVKKSDIVNRGLQGTEIIDFLKVKKEDIKQDFSRDIITNPPYKFAKEFVENALKISMDGVKIAMFLKLTFLESKARKELFKKYPPKTVYVFAERMKCFANGVDDGKSSAVAYAWFVWEKGFAGNPVIKWL